jgi:hypothetical protein
MLNKTKIALAIALIAGTASAALASNENDDKGGFVVPGSTAGVNPAYHSTRFPDYAGQAYGYVVPQKAPHAAAHARPQNR